MERLIDIPLLVNILRKKGFNEVWIEEIAESVKVKQLLDDFKREKGLPVEEWKGKDQEMY
jgi:hypothetical protein